MWNVSQVRLKVSERRWFLLQVLTGTTFSCSREEEYFELFSVFFNGVMWDVFSQNPFVMQSVNQDSSVFFVVFECLRHPFCIPQLKSIRTFHWRPLQHDRAHDKNLFIFSLERKDSSVPWLPVNASDLWNVNSVTFFFFKFLHLIYRRQLEEGLQHAGKPVVSAGLWCCRWLWYMFHQLVRMWRSALTNWSGSPWDTPLDTDFGALWGLEFLVLYLTCQALAWQVPAKGVTLILR